MSWRRASSLLWRREIFVLPVDLGPKWSKRQNQIEVPQGQKVRSGGVVSFAAMRRNDGVAPIGDLRAAASHRQSSTQTGPLRWHEDFSPP